MGLSLEAQVATTTDSVWNKLCETREQLGKLFMLVAEAASCSLIAGKNTSQQMGHGACA
jgi:hypothetical protein